MRAWGPGVLACVLIPAASAAATPARCAWLLGALALNNVTPAPAADGWAPAQAELRRFFADHSGRDFVSVDTRGPIVLRAHKWRVNGSVVREITPTTLGRGRWTSLSAKLDAMPPALWSITTTDQPVQTRRLGADGFEITSGQETTVLHVARPNPFRARARVGFAHMNAPLANGWRSIVGTATLEPPLVDPTVLRHDLSQTRLVYLDENFPARYEAALQSALDQWNYAYRTRFYVLAGRRKLNAPECFAGRDLCVFWSGPETFALDGPSATTSFAYDPDSGLIEGGVIAFDARGLAEPDLSLTDAESAAIRDADTAKAHLAVVADLSVRADRWRIRHPFPEAMVQATSTHELGHDGAFRHYFLGSAAMDTEPGLLSDTVMEYLPGAVAHTMNRLGSRDLRKVDHIYFHGPAVTEMPCSDAETASVTICKPQDLGRTDQWLLRLAERAPRGLLTESLAAGGLSLLLNQPQPIYKLLEPFLGLRVAPAEGRLSARERRERRTSEAILEKSMSASGQGITPAMRLSVRRVLCEGEGRARIESSISAFEKNQLSTWCEGVRY